MATPPRRLVASILFISAILAMAHLTLAQAQDDADKSTTSPRDWNYPTQGPTPQQSRAAGADPHWWENGPWSAGVSFGPAWFSGDGISGGTDFMVDAYIARDLTHDTYLLGGYTVLFPETKVRTANGVSDEETHDLHAITFGAGFRFDVTDEVQLFVEPRAGVLFGGDADAGPVGMLSAGVEVLATDRVFIRVALTGLLTDADINTAGPDANLDSGFMATVGIAFQF